MSGEWHDASDRVNDNTISDFTQGIPYIVKDRISKRYIYTNIHILSVCLSTYLSIYLSLYIYMVFTTEGFFEVAIAMHML